MVVRTCFDCQSYFRNDISLGAVVVVIRSLQGAHLHEKDGMTPSLVFAERHAISGSFVIWGFNSATTYSHSMLWRCYEGFFAFFYC